MREAEDSGVSRCEGLGTAAGGEDFKRHCTGAKGRNTPLLRARLLRAHADVSLVEREYLLAATGGGNGRWEGCELEVTQDARDDRLLGDGGNDAQ